MSGIKHDQGKLPMELLPPELFTRIARVLQFGAEKYAPRNWEKGMDWGRLYAAAMRHLTAWWGGEDTDPETGFSHLDHAACCIMFLFTYEERGLGEDDRPVQGPGRVAGLVATVDRFAVWCDGPQSYRVLGPDDETRAFYASYAGALKYARELANDK